MEIEIIREAEEFILDLPIKDRAKIKTELDLLRIMGLDYPHLRPIEGKLWEIKIRDIRLFYFMRESSLAIICGYVKKTAKTPTQEKERALRIMARLSGGVNK